MNRRELFMMALGMSSATLVPSKPAPIPVGQLTQPITVVLTVDCDVLAKGIVSQTIKEALVPRRKAEAVARRMLDRMKS